MSLIRVVVLFVLAISLAAGTYGCKKEGPAERAGKEFDRALEKAKDKIDEATK